MLDLHFSELPSSVSLDNLPTLSTKLGQARTPYFRTRLPVNWLPVLRIGLVVRHGVVVAQLGADVQTFLFDAASHCSSIEPRLRPAASSTPIRQPRLQTAHARPEMLSHFHYPLWGQENGYLLHFASKNIDASIPSLAVPCAEIIRRLYAPHSSLAVAMLNGAWSDNRQKVLDLRETQPTDRGWRVATVAPLREQHIAIAGNLMLNPLARIRANLIRTRILQQDGSGGLSADLPFEWTRLKLKVAAFLLRPDSNLWFGFEVLAVQWPDPPAGPPDHIDWLPLHSRPSTFETDGAEPSLRPPLQPQAPPEGEIVDVEGFIDPGPGPETDIEEPGAEMLNAPLINRLPLEPVERTRKEGTPAVPSEPSLGLSGGEQARGKTGYTKATPQTGASQPASMHFTEVLDALQHLRQKGSIVSYEVLAPLSQSSTHRGDVHCWALPPIPVAADGPDASCIQWWVRDFESPGSTKPKVGRAAMVVRIATTDEVAYLLEIEPRLYGAVASGSKGLVFVPVETIRWSVQVVLPLLHIACLKAGVWPSHSELSALLEGSQGSVITASTTWMHRRGKGGDGLSAAGLLSVIDRVIK